MFQRHDQCYASALSNTRVRSKDPFPSRPYDWSEFVVYEPTTDANFQDAVNLWFSDEANADLRPCDWNVHWLHMSSAFSNWGPANTHSMKT